MQEILITRTLSSQADLLEEIQRRGKRARPGIARLTWELMESIIQTGSPSLSPMERIEAAVRNWADVQQHIQHAHVAMMIEIAETYLTEHRFRVLLAQAVTSPALPTPHLPSL